MKLFAPELAQHWIARSPERSDDKSARGDEDMLSASQQEALEALAERVNAARSTA